MHRVIQRLSGYVAVVFSLLAFLALATPASARQCKPMLDGKRSTLIVPHTPGGGFDSYARIFASQFEATTGSVMRIRNMPGAGAMIGINAVVEAGPADLILGLFDPTILFNDMILGRDSHEMSSLIMLGSLHTDATVWAARKNEPVLFESSEPRLFAMASNSDFTKILLPGYALGWNVNMIRGYDGSTDAMFAILRGDVDFFYTSSISLANRIQSLDGLTASISLSDGPNPIFPEAAYLAGAGGIVEQLTGELNVEQQRERGEVAMLAVELAMNHRAISISGGADPELVDCLLSVVEASIFSEELRTAAALQNLEIEPKDGVAFQEELDRTEALIDSNWDMLQELVAGLR